jgi:hypothetical protein
MNLRRFVRRLAVNAFVGIAATAGVPGAWATSLGQLAYYPAWGNGVFDAVLIDWRSAGQVRVVIGAGAQSGSSTQAGSQAVITLNAPISKLQVSSELNSCDEQSTQRKDTTALVVRDVRGNPKRGVSQIVEIGTLTNVDGCDAGAVVPFGTLTDAGKTMKRVAMSGRPSVRDVTPGTVMAGFGEFEWPVDYEFSWETDLVTLYAGGQALFARSGHLVHAEFNNDKWLVFDLPAGQRAFTRLEVDDETGAETWLRAEWAGGLPQRVIADLVVKTEAKAGFGTERQTAREWQSGLFIQMPDKVLWRFFLGGTGERVDISEGSEVHNPLTWSFVGKKVLIRRTQGAGTIQRERTWVPLRNADKVRFVMENENTLRADGSTSVFIPPRVNFYIDGGRAIAP